MGLTISDPGSGLSIADLKTDPRRARKASVMRWAFALAAATSVLITTLIVVAIARDALSFFIDVDKGALFEIGWFPRRGLFDIRTLVVGSLLVAGVAMVVATPLGIGSAIYLSEYASPRFRRIVKPILEVLAGVPSVVLGYFALYFITPDLLTRINSEVSFFNMAAAGIAVGILVVPIIATVAEDAMRAVPMALREAAYGLGSRKITVALRVVFPAAVSGIIAAGIIGLSRALGETMVVAIASGATGGSLFGTDLFAPGQTMTAAMAALGAGTDQVKGNDLAFQSLYFVGALLFIITLFLNTVGDIFVRRIRERY